MQVPRLFFTKCSQHYPRWTNNIPKHQFLHHEIRFKFVFLRFYWRIKVNLEVKKEQQYN